MSTGIAIIGGAGGAVAASDVEAYTILNGSTQRVDLGTATELRFIHTDPFSVAFWFKITDSGIDNQIIGNLISGTFQGWEIDIDGGDIMANFISSGGGQLQVRTTATVNDGAWHQGVVTYDGSTNASGLTIYVDGSSVADTDAVDTLSGSFVANENMRIGSRQANNSYYFDGSLSDVGVYDIELSAANVTAISGPCARDLTVVGPTASLVGYWKLGFSNGTPLIADDLSSNSNNGTLVGGPDIRVGGPCGG